MYILYYKMTIKDHTFVSHTILSMSSTLTQCEEMQSLSYLHSFPSNTVPGETLGTSEGDGDIEGSNEGFDEGDKVGAEETLGDEVGTEDGTEEGVVLGVTDLWIPPPHEQHASKTVFFLNWIVPKRWHKSFVNALQSRASSFSSSSKVHSGSSIQLEG